MTEGNIRLGKVAFTDKGAYSKTVTYNTFEFVTTEDSCYLSVKASNKGNALTDTSYWKCISSGVKATDAASKAVKATEEVVLLEKSISDNEQERARLEGLRVKAESSRVSKEEGRNASESERIRKENERISAEQARGLELSKHNTSHEAHAYLQTLINSKVAKIEGKNLSEEDFTRLLKQKLESLSNYNDVALISAITALNGRIDTLIGTSASEAIDTFKEIEEFLQGITDAETLTGMLNDIEAEMVKLIPTRASQLNNDDHTVKDESYVHTDSNYTTTEKNKLGGVEEGANKTSVDASLDKASLNPVQNKVLSDKFTEVDGEISKLKMGISDYYVAGWNPEDLNPDAVEFRGDRAFMDRWFPMLIDTTDNAGMVTTPVGVLRRNNYLRFEDGTFAPVVGIKEEQRAECDVALYLDAAATQKYCDALGFDAKDFYDAHGMAPLYNAEGVEVRVLRPWETTETKYTIGIGRRETVYVCDGLGRSGKYWKGLFLKPIQWDGIDTGNFPLAPTAISPCPITTVGGKTRNFFYLYAPDNTNSDGGKGASNICSLFQNGRTYPRTRDCQQINNMNWARANNADVNAPYPFSEGGFHALNAFLLSQEAMYGTNYLHRTGLFSSGISSNDACNNENAFLSNGGVRYKVSGDESWLYTIFSGQGSIYHTSSGSRANFSSLLNSENAKQQCMESQIAASFAKETGVKEGELFSFYGSDYWYKNITGVNGLQEDRMNVLVYKTMDCSISAFDVSGNATDFDIEVRLRMNLINGMNAVGDIFAYWGGGYEQVGTRLYPTSASKNNPVKLYLEPEQTKWLREIAVLKNDNEEFDFERSYRLLGESVNLGDGYAKKRLSYAGWRTTAGGGLGNGQCYYTLDNNNWSTKLNQRVRIAARFRGFATNGFDCFRFLHAYSAVSYANATNGGSAQVLIGAAHLQAE